MRWGICLEKITSEWGRKMGGTNAKYTSSQLQGNSCERKKDEGGTKRSKFQRRGSQAPKGKGGRVCHLSKKKKEENRHAISSRDYEWKIRGSGVQARRTASGGDATQPRPTMGMTYRLMGPTESRAKGKAREGRCGGTTGTPSKGGEVASRSERLFDSPEKTRGDTGAYRKQEEKWQGNGEPCRAWIRCQ